MPLHTFHTSEFTGVEHSRTEIAFPFQIDVNGGIAAVATMPEIVRSHLRQLLGTVPEERVMRPEYGVNVPAYVFEPDDNATLQQLSVDVHDAIGIWEPDITIESLEPITNHNDDGVIGFNVVYRVGTEDTGITQTAFIAVGGTVTETYR